MPNDSLNRLTMRYISPILFFLISALIFSSCASSPSYTIMTYNIRHGVGMDRVLDLERTASVIKALDPDILILNEVDHGTERSFGVLQTDSLGKLLDMHSSFGRSIDYDGGQYGNALLTKFPVLDFQVVDLSTDSLLEGRSVFLASLLLDTDTLFIMGTHLGLEPAERNEQIKRIIQVLPNSATLILGGDFNFEPNSNTYFDLTKHLQDGIRQHRPQAENTYPADQPDRRIDYIFIGSNIKAIGIPALTPNEVSTASDHRPQVLRFRLK